MGNKERALSYLHVCFGKDGNPEIEVAGNREELTELCVSLMAGIAIMYGGITKAAYLTSMKVAASELVSRAVEQ